MANKSKLQFLPADIIYEILTCLPVRTLRRFLSVCKSWRSLIYSLEFQKDHYRRSQKNPLLLTIGNRGEQDRFDPCSLHLSTYNNMVGNPVQFFSQKVHYPFLCEQGIHVQSCLGFTCLATRLVHSRMSILICNPSTKEFIFLPTTIGYTLCIGFYYSSSTEKFKVVRIFQEFRSKGIKCETFILGTTEWKESIHFSKCNIRPPVNLGPAPFLHGALHFLSFYYKHEQDNDCIIVFDVESEEYKWMSLPVCNYKFDNRCLGELGGSLWLSLIRDCARRDWLFELWLLKDYDNVDWVKQYTICPKLLIRGPSSSLVYGFWRRFSVWVVPLWIMGDGCILLKVYHENKIDVLCYDPREEIVTREIDRNCSVTIFSESLFSLENI